MTVPTKADIDELESLMSGLPAGGQKFAASLIRQARARGLTVRQEPYVFKLIEQVKNPPKQVTAKVRGDMGKAYSFFFSARSHLKFPKVMLRTRVGGGPSEDVKIHMSGPNSKRPDVLNITLPDRPGKYAGGKWIGRIDAAGNWEIPASAGADIIEPVKKLLVDLGKNPHKVASEHGKLTGACCFCNRHLEDDRSTGVGYGPVCAKNFGLSEEWKKGDGVKSVKGGRGRRVTTGRTAH